MDRDSAAPPHRPRAGLRRLLARLRRLLDTRADRKDGRTGTCRLCGERRHDLDESGLCRPCAMAAW
jgi:hypothetical protein